MSIKIGKEGGIFTLDCSILSKHPNARLGVGITLLVITFLTSLAILPGGAGILGHIIQNSSLQYISLPLAISLTVVGGSSLIPFFILSVILMVAFFRKRPSKTIDYRKITYCTTGRSADAAD